MVCSRRGLGVCGVRALGRDRVRQGFVMAPGLRVCSCEAQWYGCWWSHLQALVAATVPSRSSASDCFMLQSALFAGEVRGLHFSGLCGWMDAKQVPEHMRGVSATLQCRVCVSRGGARWVGGPCGHPGQRRRKRRRRAAGL